LNLEHLQEIIITIAQLSSVDNANCDFLVIFIFEADILGVMHDFCV